MTDKKKSGSESAKWYTAAFILTAAVVFMAYVEGVFTKETVREFMYALCNSFFVPGVVYAGIGGLSFVSSQGGFDSFGYLFSTFSLHSLLPTRQPKHYNSYYEYKTAKDEKGRAWLPHILILGCVSIGISIVILVISYLV
jgi:multisubunit Na+/H+ antiporter MnhC subunit